MKTNDEIVKSVIETCENLENILNGDLLKRFVEMHNIDSEHSIIKLKQEIIASCTIFLDKKIYGLYIINKEKKPVDDFEVKGMILRKSSFPLFTKEKVKGLLDLILKRDTLNMSVIKEYLDIAEKEVLQMCMDKKVEIAGSVSYNDDIENYKQVPSHVKAMELFNELEYKYFVNGTKGWLFRIHGIDEHIAPQNVLDKMYLMTHKNKSIVIPIESEELPPYYILDINAQMEYCWYKRVSEIMEVLTHDESCDINPFIEDLFE